MAFEEFGGRVSLKDSLVTSGPAEGHVEKGDWTFQEAWPDHFLKMKLCGAGGRGGAGL